MLFFEKKSPVDGVPVIPGGSYLTGHLALLREADFDKALHKWSVEHADGQGRVTFWMGPTTPALSVTHPQDVQTLLKATSHRELFPLLEKLMERFFGKQNLATLTGKEWKAKRSIIVKALHGQHVVENNRQAFRQAAETLVERLKKEEAVDDLQRVLQMLTLDAFGQAVLQTDFECCKNLQPNALAQDFDFLGQEIMRRMVTSPMDPSNYIQSLPTTSNKNLANANQRIAYFIGNLIDQRKQTMMSESNDDPKTPPQQDLLSNLIRASEQNGVDFSEDSIADVVKSLLFAGFETSSTALAFALYLIATHPDVEQHCVDEISLANGNATTADDFPFLNAVVTETLRLYPPAISTTRSSDRDIELQPNDWKSEDNTDDSDDKGTTIMVPKGTYLYVPIWIIQRLSKNFEDPTQFRPERWMKNGSDSKPKSNRDAFVAFSSGGRSCAGEKFAMQEMVIVLSILLKEFKFELRNNDSDGKELQVHREGIVISPKEPVSMTITRR